MIDELDDTLKVTLPRGRAAELGIASLLMGMTLFLASPLTLVLAVLVWRFADQEPGVVHLHAWLARVGVSIAVIVAGTAVAFGWVGLRFAKRAGEPKGLCVAGVLLSSAAFALWIITAIGTLNATESLLKLHGR